MNPRAQILLAGTRVSLGWLFFYAGITKLLNPEWSAGGFIGGAKNLTGFYGWLGSEQVLPFVNFLNEWGLTLLGVSLILGALVRLSAPLGALLMILYWIPRLQNFKPDANSFIVDQHIIYAFALLFLAAIHAGRYWGLDSKLSQIKLFKKLG
jgi:thiosulfate dehydrogenase [quinone] large subunit